MKRKLGRRTGKETTTFVQMGNYNPKTGARTQTKFAVIYNVSHARLKKEIERMIQGFNK